MYFSILLVRQKCATVNFEGMIKSRRGDYSLPPTPTPVTALNPSRGSDNAISWTFGETLHYDVASVSRLVYVYILSICYVCEEFYH